MKAIVKRMGSGSEVHDVVEERVSTVRMACGQTPLRHRVRLVEAVPSREQALATCPRCIEALDKLQEVAS